MRSLGYVFFLAAPMVGLAVYFWRLSLTVPAPPDPSLSDFANTLFYAQSLLNGNVFLHGWVITQDPYWLDDIVYVLGLKTRGPDPALFHLVPTVVYTSLVAVAAWTSVAVLNLRSTERVVVIGVAILPLVFPSHALASWVLVGPYHTSTTAAALGAILALIPRDETRHNVVRVLLAVLGWALLAIGRFGDPYMLALGVVPIIIIAVYVAIARNAPLWKTAAFPPMVAALAAWGAAEAGLWLVPRLGGFTMRVSIAPTIPLEQLGGALLTFIRAYLDLSGANFFGMSLGRQFLIAVIRLAYLCAATWASVRVLGDLRRGVQQDWTTAVLAIAVAVSGVGTFLYPGTYDEYRVPVFILMSVVLARYLATTYRQWLTNLTRRRSTAAALLCGGFLFAVLPVQQFRHPQGFDDPSHVPQLALARWLEQQGLNQGYGPYGWASIITVETHGFVTIRPLISTNRYYPLPPSRWRLVPNTEMMADTAWYTGTHPAFFLIVDNGDVNDQAALQTFGAPEHTYHVAGVVIVTYKDGIACMVPTSVQARTEEAAGLPPHEARCGRQHTEYPRPR